MLAYYIQHTERTVPYETAVNQGTCKSKEDLVFFASSAPHRLANIGHASIPATQIEGRPESGREAAIISSLANKGLGSGAHFQR